MPNFLNMCLSWGLPIGCDAQYRAMSSMAGLKEGFQCTIGMMTRCMSQRGDALRGELQTERAPCEGHLPTYVTLAPELCRLSQCTSANTTSTLRSTVSSYF